MIYITMYYTAPISNRVVPLPCIAFSTFIASQASNSLRSNPFSSYLHPPRTPPPSASSYSSASSYMPPPPSLASSSLASTSSYASMLTSVVGVSSLSYHHHCIVVVVVSSSSYRHRRIAVVVASLLLSCCHCQWWSHVIINVFISSSIRCISRQLMLIVGCWMQPQQIYPLPHLDVVDATLLSIVFVSLVVVHCCCR